MKKTACLMVMAAVAASAPLLAVAAEIAFTGADASAPTDLSSPGNWDGGALPGSGDVGVVDYSTYAGGNTLSVSSDMALAGLRITNASAAVTMTGAGTLSLGADGLAYDAAQTFTLRAPVAVTAPQFWNFALGTFESWSTISGTDALCVTNCGIVNFRAAPQFDGDLTCHAMGVRHYTTGKVARKLVTRMSTGKDQKDNHNYFLFGGEARWSDMFTGGTYEYINWRRFFLSVTNNAVEVPSVIMDSDSDYLYQHGPYRTGVSAGRFDQRAGKLYSQSYGFAVGTPDNEGFINNHGDYPAEYRISGSALFDMAYLFVGGGSQKAANHPFVVQNGGTVKIGKGLYVGGDSSSATPGFGEYVMSNGTLTAGISNNGSDHQTRGIVLCQPFGGAGTSPGVFTLAGGSASAFAVKFGPDSAAWGAAAPAVNNGFGLFEMTGGTLDLKATSFSLGVGWNKTATNSTYRINLSGGQVDFAAAQTIKTDLFFPPGGNGATLNTGTYNVQVDAAISGDGTIRKSGAGQLTLKDANRFTGDIDVEEGIVMVPGTVDLSMAPAASGDDCWTWTADSLTNAFAHGDTVASWPDDVHGLSAVDWTNANCIAYQHASSYSYKGKLPTLATNGYFNGHAAMNFNNACLLVPAAGNPLAGETNFTMVVVFRPNNIHGNDNIWYGHTFFAGTDYEYSADVPVFTYDGAGRLMLGLVTFPDGNTRGAYTIRSRETKDLNNSVNVAVATIRGLEFELNLNGYVTNRNVSAQYTSRPMFKRGTVSLPLCFGGHFPDSINFRSSNQFIPEIRIYKGRTFSIAEQNAIVGELLQKYRGDAAGIDELRLEASNGLAGALNGETAPAAPVATAGEWTADSLDGVLDDGATVTAWPNADGTKTATAATANAPGPKFVKDAMNGRSVLRFDGTQGIGIPAADSPVSGQANYTVAVVFRTTTDGTGTSTFRWDRTTGLVSSKATTWNAEDFAIAMGTEGTVGGFYGDRNGNSQQIWDRRPFRLHDGLPHVAVMAVTAEKKMWFMIDGRLHTATFTTGGGTARASRNVLIGMMSDNLGYFTGDIAAVRLYGEALDAEQMATLSEHYAHEYGFRLMPKLAPGDKSLAVNGLAATNLHVAAGASFVVPLSEDAPFSFTHGVGRLTGDGKFLGSYRYAAGSTLDTATLAANVEDLQVVGAALRFSPGETLPWTPSSLSRVSGEIAVDVSAWEGVSSIPSRVTLAEFDPAAVEPGTVFTRKGLNNGTTIVYDPATGALQMDTLTGLRIIFR